MQRPRFKLKTTQTAKLIRYLLVILPLLSAGIAVFVLYMIEYSAYPAYPMMNQPPVSSFETTWKGRTFYLFFLWLVGLEVIIGWDKLKSTKLAKLGSLRTTAFLISLILPSLYVVLANMPQINMLSVQFQGLNRAMVDLSYSAGVIQNAGYDWIPLAIEYLVLGILFSLTIMLEYGVSGLGSFSISPLFLLIIGFLYTIDAVQPFGNFTPFQMLVPATATVAASVLNFMGFTTTWQEQPSAGTPVLQVTNAHGASATYGIAWPCSGIESLIIYTVTLVLFMRSMAVPMWHKLTYFAVGAAVTFFINALRIASIFTITLNEGAASASVFHNFYGQFYSIIWIVSYPMIILGLQAVFSRLSLGRRLFRSSVEISNKPM